MLDLKWNIPMFLSRIRIPFVLEKRKGTDQLRPRIFRFDHFVNEAALGCDVRICKLFPEFRDQFLPVFVGIRCVR